MKLNAAEVFKFDHRLAPLKIVSNFSFSKREELLGDLSRQYNVTLVDVFDFLGTLFANEKFLYLFQTKLTLNEKKVLQLICRQISVNKDVFFEVFPVLLKNELIRFEQYANHLMHRYSKLNYKDPLIQSPNDPDQSGLSENQSRAESADSESGDKDESREKNQDAEPASEEPSHTERGRSLRIQDLMEEIEKVRTEHHYESQHDAFVMRGRDAQWAGVASFYIRLLKFRLQFNDCRNQGFILLNVEKLFRGLDLGHFFYSHPLLSVGDDSLSNSFAQILYSLHGRPLKFNFFSNRDRNRLFAWDNFDVIYVAFQFYKRTQRLKSLNNLDITDFFHFMRKYFIPESISEKASKSTMTKSQEDSATRSVQPETPQADARTLEDTHSANSGREKPPPQPQRDPGQFAEIQSLFSFVDFYNCEEPLKPWTVEAFVELNLDEEDRNEENEMIFLENLVFTNLEFTQAVKLWGEALDRENPRERILQGIETKEKSATREKNAAQKPSSEFESNSEPQRGNFETESEGGIHVSLTRTRPKPTCARISRRSAKVG